jgi:hypothetical protein
VNVNDRNGVLAMLHEALDGRRRVLQNPHAKAEEMIRVAEEFKADPRYRDVTVKKSGPRLVTFELARGES